MEKFYKNFQIARLIIWFLVVAFVLLRIFVADIFTYFAVITATIGFILVGLTMLFKYRDLKQKIEEGFDIYLADNLRDGFITQQQFDERDEGLYKEYKRLYKTEKFLKVVYFLLAFAIAISLIIWLLKMWL